ncbi:isocitrate lyase/PEP mutase family protein [Actinophytocola oryzae]|uniref:2-methylisocitrate lyase-like PEP mutase family enzyme n=1 Tax=Actinophytocola oryzae TaxID=502181 RepID=A0A4R7UVN9_9PSEU|nr:isocitrate lyase/phosphoenolpyruvate mutase family protein [Actinophytocola oryzae]TDV40097.1 2-methylisocitrate lyase-like PEP mutase family enzyme [Actinophytocola oryzae]
MNFRDRHTSGGPLVLPNAWDAASARIIEQSGAEAIATTSAGVAWSLGVPDGDRLAVDDAVDAVARIVRAVDLPVTADIESGYGDTADTVKKVVDVGVVGINIEDGATAQVQRIADARAAGGNVFVNARIDTFLQGVGGVDETVERARRYLDAGADGIFVPGVVDPDIIRELVSRISAPLNIMVWAGAPSVAELAELGVRRISVGPAITTAAYSLVRDAATEILRAGTYDRTVTTLTNGDLNSAFAH